MPSIAEFTPWLPVYAVMVGPFSEELVFRSVAYRGLATRFRPVVATTITSLIFALIHAWSIDGLIGLCGAYALSVVNIKLLHKSRSLWPAIACHMTVNALVFAFGLVEYSVVGVGDAYL